MITGTRYVAWFTLSIGLVLAIVGVISFFFNIQGMVLNGSPVTSTGQKYEFVFTAFALSGLSALAIVLLRPKLLNRIRLIAKYASLLEHLPVKRGRCQFYAIIALPLVSVTAIGLIPGIPLTDRLYFIVGVPIALGIGFLSTFLVVGFQVINPFCPERVLRFFGIPSLGSDQANIPK